jgi:CHAD domain-containing protein
MIRERELKFQVPTGVELPDFDAKQAAPVRLDATYYDTPQFRLARFGATLRFRNDEGWCVKLPGTTEGALISRREVTFSGVPGEPPEAATALVSSLTRGASVAAVANVSSSRRSVSLGVGELVDDEVVACEPDGGVIAQFREIELELAPTATLLDARPVLDSLRSIGAAPAAPLPKLVRALGPRAAAPSDVEPSSLVGEPTLREVVQYAMATSTRGLLFALPGVRLDEDPEYVHQARVTIRRLRSQLRTFRDLCDRVWADELNRDLQRLGRVLGGVRDTDVLAATVASMPLGEPGRTQLLASINGDRQAPRHRLLDLLDDPWCAAMLERLVEAAADPVLAPQADDPARPVLPSLVARPWRRLRRAVRSLPEPPSDEALHEVRILAKRCRYAADAVRPVIGAPAQRFAKGMAALQDELGHLNDVVVITPRLERVAQTSDNAAAYAAGKASGILVERDCLHRSAWEAAWREASKKSVTAWLR